MPDLITVTCPNCLTKFETNRTDKKFCKARCKIQYWMKNHPRIDLTKSNEARQVFNPELDQKIKKKENSK